MEEIERYEHGLGSKKSTVQVQNGITRTHVKRNSAIEF